MQKIVVLVLCSIKPGLRKDDEDMFVYTTEIIDWWNGWQTPEQFMDGLAHISDPYTPSGSRQFWQNWNRLWARACHGASKLGFEGDIIAGPYVTVLPPEQDGHCGLPPIVIGWKQSNNGMTFIASEIEIPWLNPFYDERTMSEKVKLWLSRHEELSSHPAVMDLLNVLSGPF